MQLLTEYNLYSKGGCAKCDKSSQINLFVYCIRCTKHSKRLVKRVNSMTKPSKWKCHWCNVLTADWLT